MSQGEQRAIHFQHLLQYLQVIFMTLWQSRSRRLCKVESLIGSEARDALRGQRSHMLHEHQVLVQAGEREEECLALRKQILHDAKRWINIQSLSKTAQLDLKIGSCAELRIKRRLWLCELPDSPDSSDYAPSSNECDEDDFDFWSIH